jgi:hypothetical protein
MVLLWADAVVFFTQPGMFPGWANWFWVEVAAGVLGLAGVSGTVLLFPSGASPTRQVLTALLVAGLGIAARKSVLVAVDAAGFDLDRSDQQDILLQRAVAPGSQRISLRVEWERVIPKAAAICSGDWDGDGRQELLVADTNRMLHVLGLDGATRQTVALPSALQQIDFGNPDVSGPVLIGCDRPRREVMALDRGGKKVWSRFYMSETYGGLWADVDADGVHDGVFVGTTGANGIDPNERELPRYSRFHDMGGYGELEMLDARGNSQWMDANNGYFASYAVVPRAESNELIITTTVHGGNLWGITARGWNRTSGPRFYASGIVGAILVAADDMSGTGDIQIVAAGHTSLLESERACILCLDTSGTILWDLVLDGAKSWVAPVFASGDFSGDGTKEWAIAASDTELIFVSAEGEKLGTLPTRRKPAGMGALKAADRDRLVLLADDRVACYSVPKSGGIRQLRVSGR